MNINDKFSLPLLPSLPPRFTWQYDHSDITCIIDDIFSGCSSHVVIEWFIPDNTTAGNYRIQHFGAYKDNGIHEYQGTSKTFKVNGV